MNILRRTFNDYPILSSKPFDQLNRFYYRLFQDIERSSGLSTLLTYLTSPSIEALQPDFRSKSVQQINMSHQVFKTESQTSLIRHDTTDSTQNAAAQKKKQQSLFQRLQSKKRAEISEEDLLKYTGMTKDGLAEWTKDRPGVGKNKGVEGAVGPPQAVSIVGSGY
ncbi:hypothetical protein CI238_10911 [Colletotrichum incanum]|uniref:Uncharacterized protein n=1 Tax=Colletotrichum incanum TaxID=1573173 RepID=A0A167B6W5_COLIC|nr:hypothetical protein CI238_10911 [Colletotrichum incanum]